MGAIMYQMYMPHEYQMTEYAENIESILFQHTLAVVHWPRFSGRTENGTLIIFNDFSFYDFLPKIC